MGTRLRLVVDAPTHVEAATAAEAALEEVERLDALLGTWVPETPMSRFNRAPRGRWVALEPELLGLLVEARAWADTTDGAFDPAVGALVDAWGLRGRGRRPTSAELGHAVALSSPDVLELDRGSGTARWRRSGAWIDTGAFGKGAALRALIDVLARRGVERAFVDLGGQVLALAPRAGARWPVEVAHPRRRHEPFARLHLAGVSAATSGTSERWVEVGGARIGHILDPRTGRPAPAWGSVTVVSADPFVADILSTALYVMGPEAGMAWARARADLGALFLVEREGCVEARWNPAMERWLDLSSLPENPTER